jgi:PBP1b-binding outer membrane lipoprotein LpoB
MKKILLVAFLGTLALTACSKKTTSTESNTMLPEPDSTTLATDTTSMSKPAAMDSTAMVMPMKTDSTKMAK